VKTERQIIFYKNYFLDFYRQQPIKVQEKIEHTLILIRTVEKVPAKFLSHITGSAGLYEIRIEYGSDIYRVFCCFDKNNLVVLFNAFQKKSQKTPQGELRMAEKLKKEYFENKIKKNEK
jgi:phage-related protein